MNMKSTLLMLITLLISSFTALAGSASNTVSLSTETLVAYLESELSYPNEENVDLKIKKIHNQMKLLDPVTNAASPQVWQYRHDKLEYLLGCLYLEVGNRELAYLHLKTCIWNCGRFDVHARRLLEREFKDHDSNKVPDPSVAPAPQIQR